MTTTRYDGMCYYNRSAVMLDGEVSNYADTLQGVAQECTLSTNLLKVYT